MCNAGTNSALPQQSANIGESGTDMLSGSGVTVVAERQSIVFGDEKTLGQAVYQSHIQSRTLQADRLFKCEGLNLQQHLKKTNQKVYFENKLYPL